MLCIVTKKEKGGTISSAELIEKAIESERERFGFCIMNQTENCKQAKSPKVASYTVLPQIN